MFLAITSISSALGTKRKRVLLGFSAILAVVTVLSFFLLPKRTSFLKCTSSDVKTWAKSHRKTLEKEHSAVSLTSLCEDNSDLLDRAQAPGVCPTPNNNDEEMPSSPPLSSQQQELEMASAAVDPSPMQQMRSIEYVLLCIWFSACVVPLQYYVGSIGFQLERHGDDTGFYTTMFSVIYAAVSMVALLAGYMADQCSLGISQAIATVLTAGALFFLAVLSEISLNAHILGMIMYGMARLYVYSTFFANIGKRFGYQRNFGTLTGAGLFVSSIFSLLQYPLIAWADDGHDILVNVGSGGALLAFLPYCYWLHKRQIA